jgi:ketosteroid isomerase-like protein
MRMLALTSSLVVAIAAATACDRADRPFTSADEAAIRTASRDYAKAETSGNFDQWFAYSTPDAIYMPDGSKAMQGHDALAAWFRQMPPGLTLETSIQEISGHGGIALERGSYAVGTQAQAGTSGRDTGNYIAVWQRQSDGSWKTTRAIWNVDHP